MDILKTIAIICMAGSWGVAIGYLVTEAHWKRRYKKLNCLTKKKRLALAKAQLQRKFDLDTIESLKEALAINEERMALEFQYRKNWE